MMNSSGPRFNRRSLLKSSVALLAGGAVSQIAEAEPEFKNANLASGPSSLKITDMRYAVIVKPGPSPCVLIRIDTNQGVYGLGEVRDIAGPQYAMVLKSRILGEKSRCASITCFRRLRSLAAARGRPVVYARWRWRYGILPARSITSRFTRCLGESGVMRFVSMRIPLSLRTLRNTDVAPKSERRWASPG